MKTRKFTISIVAFSKKATADKKCTSEELKQICIELCDNGKTVEDRNLADSYYEELTNGEGRIEHRGAILYVNEDL